MSFTAADRWQCIKCGRYEAVGPCPNCGGSRYDRWNYTDDAKMHECARCKQQVRGFECGVCGARTSLEVAKFEPVKTSPLGWLYLAVMSVVTIVIIYYWYLTG